MSMIELVDTHCHIQSAGLSEGGEQTTRKIWSKAEGLNPKKLVQSANDNGVTRLIVVGCDLQDSHLATNFVQTQPSCWAAIGIHPHEAKHYKGNDSLKRQFTKLAEQAKVVAIGECGLDYYYNHSSKDDQIELLRYQIELSLTRNLPLIFHVREAFDDFWPIFDSYKNIRGVLHSFTDNAYNLAKALERNLMIGVNGISTFAKDPQQIEVYKSVPLSNLVLETDSPFLAPRPFRGKVNEPKNLRTIAEFLANLQEVDIESLASATTANARKLFVI